MQKEQGRPFRSDRITMYKRGVEQAIKQGISGVKDEQTAPQVERGKFRAGWQIHSSSLKDYSYTFVGINGSSLEKTFKSVAAHRANPWILDLMASTEAIEDAVRIGFGGGVAVSLGFPNPNRNPHVQSVNGNVLNRSTWAEIEEVMGAHQVKNFDVIMSRPEGGLHHITYSPSVHRMLLERAWKLLNPMGGILYFQAPTESFHIAQRYFEWLQDQGIHIAWESKINKGRNDYGVAVRMVKTPDAPFRLPNPVTKIHKK